MEDCFTKKNSSLPVILCQRSVTAPAVGDIHESAYDIIYDQRLKCGGYEKTTFRIDIRSSLDRQIISTLYVAIEVLEKNAPRYTGPAFYENEVMLFYEDCLKKMRRIALEALSGIKDNAEDKSRDMRFGSIEWSIYHDLDFYF